MIISNKASTFCQDHYFISKQKKCIYPQNLLGFEPFTCSKSCIPNSMKHFSY